MALPVLNLTNQYGAQQTASPVGDKIAVHVLAVDSTGGVGGSLYSPTTMILQGNALGAAGQSFVGSSTHLGVSLVGNARVQFTNPAGSGVTAGISAVAIYYSGGVTIYPTSFVNPTAGLPVKAGVTGNVLLGAPLPKSTILADTSSTAISGGQTYIPFCAPTGRTVFSQLNLYVPPGYSLAINIPMVASTDACVDFYWNELSN